MTSTTAWNATDAMIACYDRNMQHNEEIRLTPVQCDALRCMMAGFARNPDLWNQFNLRPEMIEAFKSFVSQIR